MSIKAIDDFLGRSFSQGGRLVLGEAELGHDFFDLSSGFAGELMQKFVNYDQRLAIIVEDASKYSGSFQDLAREHRDHPNIRFFTNEAAAQQFLASA
jgi:hypothetical protein